MKQNIFHHTFVNVYDSSTLNEKRLELFNETMLEPLFSESEDSDLEKAKTSDWENMGKIVFIGKGEIFQTFLTYFEFYCERDVRHIEKFLK